MADKVSISFTINGNSVSNWTTADEAAAAYDGLFSTTPILMAEHIEGRAVRDVQLIDSSSFTATVTWNDAADASNFWTPGPTFEQTTTEFTSHGWSASGVLTLLNDQQYTFNIPE